MKRIINIVILCFMFVNINSQEIWEQKLFELINIQEQLPDFNKLQLIDYLYISTIKSEEMKENIVDSLFTNLPILSISYAKDNNTNIIIPIFNILPHERIKEYTYDCDNFLVEIKAKIKKSINIGDKIINLKLKKENYIFETKCFISEANNYIIFEAIDS